MQTTLPLTIFIVDDEPFCLDLYRQYLRNLGQQQVKTFTSSTECLDNLAQKPDLIFLDHSMGPVNGVETLRKIKRADPNALVVFLSGQEDIAVAVTALKYGALDYLTKGQVTEERLAAVLTKAAEFQKIMASTRKRPWWRRLNAWALNGLIFMLYQLLFKF